MRPAAKIVTISPNINVSRQVSLLWGVQSINSRDANGWKDMMSISKEIIKKLKFIKKNDFGPPAFQGPSGGFRVQLAKTFLG